MTASDHLSRQQFPSMAMDQILGLHSGDAREGSDGTVRDLLPEKSEQARSPEHQILRAQMQAHGPGSIPPIHVGEDMIVRNGHRRIALAHQLGWNRMHYSSNIEDTGEDFSPEAIDRAVAKYHEARV